MTRNAEEFPHKVSHNLRGAIHFLWKHGYITFDSGDVSNYEAGMEDALPFDHVFISHDGAGTFVNRCIFLRTLLDQHGCPDVVVEGSFDPRSEVYTISVLDLNDTGQLRQLGA